MYEKYVNIVIIDHLCCTSMLIYSTNKTMEQQKKITLEDQFLAQKSQSLFPM